MTDREFRRLSRAQLIEIIYQFQLKVEELTQENQSLNSALEDKRLRVARAGNIAEAALEMNNVMQAAQNAAQQYLSEIQTLYNEIDNECQSIRVKANAEADRIIQRAQTEAAEIIAKAQADANSIAEGANRKRNAERELQDILSEFGKSFGK